ncbi:phage tail tape measure protein [Streptomyces sp. NPDC059631]|uniref:phage tail tape measure protein n=1 Tax=unclassified Streptomyces TaxID=2593676 RepID=UPI0036B40D2D
MALTVGELAATITVNERPVTAALRRVEQSMRRAGQQLGDDAERAGQDAGQQLGEGLVRGADGQWRNMRGELVDAVTAAAAEAEAEAHRAGQQTGQQFARGVDRGAQQAGDALADGVRSGGDDATTAAGQTGEASGESFLSRLRSRGQSGMGELGGSFREEFTGKLAMAAVGAAAAGALIEGFGRALEQGQIVGRLRAQLGATGPEAQRYGHIAGQLYAEAVTEDFETAAETISAVMRAGIAPPDATEAQLKSLATKVSDLATTFDLDLGQTANAVGQALKTGLAKNGTQAIDALTAGLQKMGPRADDIADTFNEYGVIFQRLGLDVTTATGLMSQGLQAGARDTDVVADALKEFTIEGVAGSSKIVQGFKDIGLNSGRMVKMISKGGPQATRALQMTLDALRKMEDPVKRDAAATELFGTKSEDMQKALLSLDPSKAVSELGKVAGSADRMGDALRDNAGTQLEAFKRKATQAFVEVLAAKAVPALTKAGGYLAQHKELAKGLAVGVGALAVAFGIATIAIWAMNSAMLANPIFWVIAGIAAAVVAIVLYWDQIKSATLAAWGWVVGKVMWAKDLILLGIGFLASIPGMIGGWFGRAKDVAVAKLVALVAWLLGLPGRATAALSGLAGALTARASAGFQSFRNAASAKVVSFLSWVRGIPRSIVSGLGNMGSLLYTKGTNVVTGLWQGILGMGGWLKSKIMGWAKSVIPGPVARALGIHSPSRVMRDQIGRWIPRGVVEGVEDEAPAVDRAMRNLVSVPTASTSAALSVAAAAAPSGAAGRAAGTDVVRIGSDGSAFGDLMVSELRKIVSSRGGNVQFVLMGKAA